MDSPASSPSAQLNDEVDKLLAAFNSQDSESETRPETRPETRQLSTPDATPAIRRAMRSVRFDGLDEENIVKGERRSRRASSKAIEASASTEPPPKPTSVAKVLKAQSLKAQKPKSATAQGLKTLRARKQTRTTGEEDAARKVASTREAKEVAATHAKIVALEAAAAKSKEREKVALAAAREVKKAAAAALKAQKSKKRTADFANTADNDNASQSQSQRKKPSPLAFKVKWSVVFDGQDVDNGWSITSTDDARWQFKQIKRSCLIKAAIYASSQETEHHIVSRKAVVTCIFNRAITSDEIDLKDMGLTDDMEAEEDCINKLIDLVRFNDASRKTGHEVICIETWSRVKGGLPPPQPSQDPTETQNSGQNAPESANIGGSGRDKKRSEKSQKQTKAYMSYEGLFWKEVRVRYLCGDSYCKNRANGALACLPLKATGHVPITGALAQVWQREMTKGRASVKKPNMKVIDMAFHQHKVNEAKKGKKESPTVPQSPFSAADNRSMNVYFGPPGMGNWPPQQQQPLQSPTPGQSRAPQSSPLSIASNDDEELENFFDLLVAKRPARKDTINEAREAFVNDAWTLQGIRKITDDPARRHKDERFCALVSQGGIRDSIGDFIGPFMRQLKHLRREKLAEMETMATNRQGGRKKPIVIREQPSNDSDSEDDTGKDELDRDADSDDDDDDDDEDDELLNMADN